MQVPLHASGPFQVALKHTELCPLDARLGQGLFLLLHLLHACPLLMDY